MKKIQYILAFLGLFFLASCLPEADTNGNYTYSGNNVSKMVVDTKSILPMASIVVSSEYSNFDSKISAPHTLPLDYSQYLMSLVSFGVPDYGSNNPSKMVVTESLLGTTTPTSITYEYDSQGYTTSARQVGGDKTTFEYTTL